VVGNFVSRWDPYRGVCEDLAERLAGRGWAVVTASSRPAKLPRLLDMVGTAWRRRHDYDVAQVDVFSGPAFLWAEAVCWTLRRARKPYVLTLHGGTLPRFARRWPGRVRRLLRSAAIVTTPSRYMLEAMTPYRADFVLLPNPLDLPAYPFRERAAPRPRLIWLRAFHETYNPAMAAQVVALLRPDFPDVTLTMIGPDKGDGSRERVARVAAELGVADRVTLGTGVPKGEVPAQLSGGGDIFLNTTNVDNTPVSVLEALACGLCVVSTNVGGIPYLLEDQVDALLVPPADPEAMAVAVRRLLTEPGLAARLSANARRKAEERDWGILVQKWDCLLGDLIPQSTARTEAPKCDSPS
jgi:glycosyltransferase involved in cell wall biosynthesis